MNRITYTEATLFIYLFIFSINKICETEKAWKKIADASQKS